MKRVLIASFCDQETEGQRISLTNPRSHTSTLRDQTAIWIEVNVTPSCLEPSSRHAHMQIYNVSLSLDPPYAIPSRMLLL